MKKLKKLTSVFLAVIMTLGVMTVAPFTVSAASCIKTQSEAVAWLKAQEGARYNLDGVYGSQCSDFSSAYINYILYGNPYAGKFGVFDAKDYVNANLYPSDWQVIKNTASFVPQPGDIFVTQGATVHGHTGVVISSTVYNADIADQNGMGDWSLEYGSPAHIHNITWTGSGTWCPKYFIRPNFASNTPHVHNYNTYVYYWKSHPHYKCYKCSCGEVKENRNETVSVDSCSLCHPVGKSTVKTDKTSYYEGENVYVTWNSVANATHYHCWLYKLNSSGTYDLVSRNDLLKGNSFVFSNLSNGSYKIYHVSYDSTRWRPDGSDWSYTISDNVYFNVGKKVVVQSVYLNNQSVTLGAGESCTLTKSVYPSNASTSYTWSSSNTSVATVSNGKVTAKKSGTAYITVKTSNGKTAQCKVTVKPAPTSVKTNPTSVTLGVGEKYTISENTNSGSYANAANLKWSTSNSGVATVAKGSANKATITARGIGTAYIKITLYNGKTAQCKVTVKPAPTSVKTNPASVTLGKGESYTISEGTNSGSYANAANLKWSTSNSSVATVTKGSANKATIKAMGIGTAYIRITLYNGKTAQCKVTVKNAPSSVSLNKTSLTLNKGASYTISESTNSGTYANAANLKWTSSNSSVATVTKGSGNKAVIKAKAKGTSYIKITLYNGKTAQCKVTVK